MKDLSPEAANPLFDIFDDKAKAAMFLSNISQEMKGLWRTLIASDKTDAMHLIAEQIPLLHVAVEDHIRSNSFGRMSALFDVTDLQNGLAQTVFKSLCQLSARDVFVSEGSVRKLESLTADYAKHYAAAEDAGQQALAQLAEIFSSKGKGNER